MAGSGNIGRGGRKRSGSGTGENNGESEDTNSKFHKKLPLAKNFD
jgi:hypothetical protein